MRPPHMRLTQLQLWITHNGNDLIWTALVIACVLVTARLLGA
ncbi:MAG TPA: hypothetical protein VED46_05135 [Alphaproteobacteria bacterium]|nr:hypothetical protein [Alphaproteobacteria bacterium]